MAMNHKAIPNSRPRQDDESFEDYRKNLRLEQIRRKEKLSGRLTWISSMVVHDGFRVLADGTEVPKYKKMSVRGTYRKEILGV